MVLYNVCTAEYKSNTTTLVILFEIIYSCLVLVQLSFARSCLYLYCNLSLRKAAAKIVWLLINPLQKLLSQQASIKSLPLPKCLDRLIASTFILFTLNNGDTWGGNYEANVRHQKGWRSYEAVAVSNIFSSYHSSHLPQDSVPKAYLFLPELSEVQ